MYSPSSSGGGSSNTPVVNPVVPTTPAVNPNQSQIDSLLAQVKSIQSVIDTAKAAGVQPGQQIPQSISGVAPTVNPNQAALDQAKTQLTNLQGQLSQATAAGYGTGTGDIQYDTNGTIVPYSGVPKDTKGIVIAPAPELGKPTAYDTQLNYINSLTLDLKNKQAAMDKAIQDQINNSKAEKEALQKQMDDFNVKIQSTIDQSNPEQTATYQQEQRIIQNKLDAAESASKTVQTNFEENQKLTNELGTLLTDVQTSLQAEKDVTGLASIRNPRIAKATETATARIGVIEAVMAARKGQITTANNLIDKAFESTQATRVDKINYLNTVLSFVNSQKDEAGNKLVNVTANEKNLIQQQINILTTEYTNAQANVDNIKQAMTDPDTALAYAQSGVTLNDSPEVINQKLSTYAYTKEISDTSNDMAGKGYTALVSGSAPAGSEVVSIIDSKGKAKT